MPSSPAYFFHWSITIMFEISIFFQVIIRAIFFERYILLVKVFFDILTSINITPRTRNNLVLLLFSYFATLSSLYLQHIKAHLGQRKSQVGKGLRLENRHLRWLVWRARRQWLSYRLFKTSQRRSGRFRGVSVSLFYGIDVKHLPGVD